MSNKSSQGMPNGIKSFTDSTADAMKATLILILTTGGDVRKSIDVANILAKEGARALVDEQFAGRSGSEITHGLAILPPVPVLTPQHQPAENLCQGYFDAINS